MADSCPMTPHAKTPQQRIAPATVADPGLPFEIALPQRPLRRCNRHSTNQTGRRAIRAFTATRAPARSLLNTGILRDQGETCAKSINAEKICERLPDQPPVSPASCPSDSPPRCESLRQRIVAMDTSRTDPSPATCIRVVPRQVHRCASH